MQMRRKDREITDIAEIKRILGENKVMRVGMCIDNIPYITPVNFGYELSEGRFIFWFHGACKGRRIDTIEKNPCVFIEIDNGCEITGGRTACDYSCDYESIMAQGTARILESYEEKRRGLIALMKHQTGMDFDFAPEDTENAAVFEVIAYQVTVKARASGK